MSDLEDQLRRANAKESAERQEQERKDRPKGGPVPGEPHDRFIAYHATIKSRDLLGWAVGIPFVIGLGITVLLLDKPVVVAILTAVSVLPIIVALGYHQMRKSRAPGEQRAYVASVPFPLTGYIETMREPRWRADWSHYVAYDPEITVHWKSPVDPTVVDQLCKLANARFRHHYNDKHPKTGTFEPEVGGVSDPWKWTRGVVAEVLIPLQERAPIATSTLTIERKIEYKSSD